MGVELFQSGKFQIAIDAFKLVKKYPIDNKMNALSLYWIAEANYKKRDFPNSIIAYRKFLEEAGGYELDLHNSAYYSIGYAYFKQKDWENAIQSFRTYTLDQNETDKVKLADANLRIGDSYFMEGLHDDEALVYYQRAIDQNGGQSDYAKYQMGKLYGYKGDYSDKANAMLDLVQNNPSSTFAVPALYEAAEAYRLMDGSHDDKAIGYYNQLIRDYPRHPLVKNAVFQIGILEFKSKKYEAAEKQFLKILNDFNDEEMKQQALDRLKDVYSALGQPEKYIALVENQWWYR